MVQNRDPAATDPRETDPAGTGMASAGTGAAPEGSAAFPTAASALRPVPFVAGPDLAAAIAAWESDLAGKSASRHTVDAYRRDLAEFLRHLGNALGRAPELDDLGGLDAAGFRAYVAHLTALQRAPASIARAVSTLRNVFRFLGPRGQAGIAAIAAVALQRPEPPSAKPIAPDAAARVVTGVALLSDEPWIAKRDAALFALLFGAGLRLGEALALTVGEAPVGDSATVGDGARRRIIPVAAEIAAAVAEYLQVRPNPNARPGRPEPDQPLFIGVRGRPLNPGVVQRQMRRIRGLLGLPDRPTPEAFRRGFLARLQAEGADLPTLRRLLGHSALATTRRAAAGLDHD